MTERKTVPGQKNFALGDAREVFERWCRSNAYDEKAIFLAAFVLFQRLEHVERRRWFALANEWFANGCKADEEGLASIPQIGQVDVRPVGTTRATTARPASSRAG